MSKETPAAAPKLASVKLLKQHTHAGEQYPQGASIKVTPIEQQWLIEQKIIANPGATAE